MGGSGCTDRESKAVRLRSKPRLRTAPEEQQKKESAITELVTPTLTLRELVAWVEAQLSDEEGIVPDDWTALPEWTDVKEAA